MDEERSKILASLPRRVDDIVSQGGERFPDKLALVDLDGAWTYRQLASAVNAARRWLAASAVRAGDRVMIVGENCKEFAALFFAILELDAVPVPVNARLSAREVDVIRRHSGARRVIYTAGSSSYAAGHAELDRAVIEQVEELGPIGLGSLQDAGTDPVDSDPTNIVGTIIYTSGTTGNPKGVMLTHRNLLFAAKTSAQVRLKTPEDRVLGVLPMSHVTGLSIQLLGTLLVGASLYLLPRFDPMKVRAAVEKNRLTILYGVPFLYTQFLEYAKLRRLKSLHFSDLRLMNTSGAPLLPTVKQAVEDLFGLPLQNGYGVSECSPVISLTRPGIPSKEASAGPPYPGVEVRIVGPGQRELPEGEIGEVWVRGPNVMKGYYRAPEDTAKVLNSEGWFNTQDLARMENGNLFIVGRTKEMIIRFGFNVYPLEVESVLNTIPGVARSAVIGRSDKDTGEQEIIAFLQLTPEANLTVAEVHKYAAQNLAPYKRPTEVRFVADMPLTLSGKVMKDELAKSLTKEA